jgi:hypothetical protein
MDTHVYIVAYVFDDENGHRSSYGNGTGFVIAGPLTFSSCTYEYGSVSVSALDLYTDPGYNGTVVFEVRWYGTGNSYSDYISAWVSVNVNTTETSKSR